MSNPAHSLVTTDSPGHRHGVEVLRFFCALVVLVWHYQHFAFTPQGFVVERPLQPYYNLLEPIYLHGAWAVQAFWCISGLVFFHRYPTRAHLIQAGWRGFWTARIARLYPLHLLTLLLVATLQAIYTLRLGLPFVYDQNDGYHLLLNLVMASHWGFQSGYSFNGPFWSVSLEVLAYAHFYVCMRHLKPWVTAGVVATTAAVLAALGWAEPFQCVVCFYLGGWLSVSRNRLPWLAGAVLAGGALLAHLAWSYQWPGANWWVVRLLLALAWLVWAFDRTEPLWRRAPATSLALGNLTYASYLIHFPLQLSLVLLAGWAGYPLHYTQPQLWWVYLFWVLVLAWLVHRHFEQPARTAIRRLLAPPYAHA